MVDQKISELDVKTALEAGDFVPIVNSATAATNKITALNLGLGMIGASAWVIASDANAYIKNCASKLQTLGYPVEVCDGIVDEVQMQAGIDG
jgi:hypothetical protein